MNIKNPFLVLKKGFSKTDKKVDEKYILSIFHTLIIIQSATFLSLNFVKSLANAKIIGTANFCMNI